MFEKTACIALSGAEIGTYTLRVRNILSIIFYLRSLILPNHLLAAK